MTLEEFSEEAKKRCSVIVPGNLEVSCIPKRFPGRDDIDCIELTVLNCVTKRAFTYIVLFDLYKGFESEKSEPKFWRKMETKFKYMTHVVNLAPAETN